MVYSLFFCGSMYIVLGKCAISRTLGGRLAQHATRRTRNPMKLHAQPTTTTTRHQDIDQSLTFALYPYITTPIIPVIAEKRKRMYVINNLSKVMIYYRPIGILSENKLSVSPPRICMPNLNIGL